MVAEVGELAGRIGNIDIVVEDTHGEGELGQFAVGHDAIGLETAVLGRTHAREIHAILRAPIVTLEIAEMTGHHREVRAPFLFQSDQHTHTDGVDTGLPHSVETIDAPLEVGLAATRMIDLIVLAVIGFLETDHAVHAMVRQFLIFLRLEGHHLNLEVGEIRFGQIQRLGQIGHTCQSRILTRHEKQILKRAKALDGLVFLKHFFRREDGALHLVGHVESTVDAGVRAGIGDIERNEHRHRTSETLLCVATRKARHLFKERFCSR